MIIKSIYENLGYYFKVWKSIAKASMAKNSLYRTELIAKLARAFMLLAMQFVFILAVFAQNRTVPGWTADQFLLLIGFYDIVNYLSWGLFSVNLWRLEEKVIKGEFDFYLLKPSGAVFTSAFYEFFVDDLVSAIAGFALIIYYLVKHWAEISIAGVFSAVFALFAAFIIWFSLELIVASFVFVSEKNGLMDLKKRFANLASYPSDIFPTKIKFFFYTILPLAFIATVPAQLFTGKIAWYWMGGGWIFAIALFAVASLIWKWNLRQYRSSGG